MTLKQKGRRGKENRVGGSGVTKNGRVTVWRGWREEKRGVFDLDPLWILFFFLINLFVSLY